VGKSGDAMFQRFQGGGGGAYFQSKPLPALTIAMLVNTGLQNNPATGVGERQSGCDLEEGADWGWLQY